MVKKLCKPGPLYPDAVSKFRPRYLTVWSVLGIALLTTACSKIEYVAGEPPKIAALDQSLRLGESSTEDVLAALGKPNGNGVILLPIDGHPRKTWSYYYEKGLIKAGNDGNLDADMRRTFLFVYFDQDRYDGYMWFSSLPE